MTVKENHLFIRGCGAGARPRFGTPLTSWTRRTCARRPGRTSRVSRACPDFKGSRVKRCSPPPSAHHRRRRPLPRRRSGGELPALFALSGGPHRLPQEQQISKSCRWPSSTVHRSSSTLYELELWARSPGPAPGLDPPGHPWRRSPLLVHPNRADRFEVRLRPRRRPPEATRRALALGGWKRRLSRHIGSQIFDLRPLSGRPGDVRLFDEVRRASACPREYRLGGGLGIRYVEGDVSVDPKFFANGWPPP